VTPAPQHPRGDAGVDGFARLWAAEVSRITYVPMRWPDKVSFLRRQTELLAAALYAEPFRDAVAYQVGVALVAADFAAPEALAATITLLHTHLAGYLRLPLSHANRVAQLAQAVSIGHCRAVRDRALDGQDAVCRAAVPARHTAEKQLLAEQARARHAALHDPVTGLPNRVLFTERLTHILHRSDRHPRFAVCVLDLDTFPAITDSLGPRAGDRLLAAVGTRLAGFAEEHRCLLARLDGTEFGLLFEDSAGAEDAAKHTDRALTLLSAPFNVDDQDLTVRASAGILESPVAGADPGEALRSARSALHWAQHDGGGRWALFDTARNAAQLHRYQVSAAIPPALARDQFTLHYQPIIQLGTGHIAGVEALARWYHPRLGEIPPGTFIPLAERTGLIVDLGHRLLEQACRDAAAWWHSLPQAPYVSVNLAAAQLRDPGIAGQVAAVLDRTGLPAHQLQLEITETVALDSGEQTRAALHTLAGLHLRLAIDDFGTGYANHASLATLPLNALKLDATFTGALRRRPQDPKAQAILANLIDLGHTLGLTVTAEGVTSTQTALLHRMRCDLGQGYQLGLPVPAAQLTAVLARQSG
jgi:diguanylate cyclase